MPERPLTASYMGNTKKSEYRWTVELVQPSRHVAQTNDVKDVIQNLQNLPMTAFLCSLSQHERIIPAAQLLRCVRRTGISEIPWADVNHHHHLCAGVFVDSAPCRVNLRACLMFCLLCESCWPRLSKAPRQCSKNGYHFGFSRISGGMDGVARITYLE